MIEPTTAGEKLAPFIKWAGGKEQELKHILPLVPPFEHYYEPFVGGGAVFFSVLARQPFINDKSPELVNLYRMIARQDDDFFGVLDKLVCSWQEISQLVDARTAGLLVAERCHAGCRTPAGLRSTASRAIRQAVRGFFATGASSFLARVTEKFDEQNQAHEDAGTAERPFARRGYHRQPGMRVKKRVLHAPALPVQPRAGTGIVARSRRRHFLFRARKC